MLQQMVQLHEELLRVEAQADDLRAERDQYIRRLIAEGQSMYSIAKALDISEQAVRKIRDGAR